MNSEIEKYIEKMKQYTSNNQQNKDIRKLERYLSKLNKYSKN